MKGILSADNGIINHIEKFSIYIYIYIKQMLSTSKFLSRTSVTSGFLTKESRAGFDDEERKEDV